MSAFGLAMKELRTEADLSVREAAARVPMSATHWWRLEQDQRHASAEIAASIDKAFDQGGRLYALREQPQARPVVAPPPLMPPAAAAGEPLGADDVDRMNATVRQLIDLDQQFGADEIYQLGLRAFRAAQARLSAGLVDPTQATEARRAAAELAEVCGWLAYDADQQDLARAMFNESQLDAELIGDWHMETFVRDLRAMQALHVGRPEEALLMARRAIDHPQVKGRMEAIFQLRRGRALAALGSEAEALDALDCSFTALADGMSSTDSPWTWWIHEAEVRLHRSLALSALGRHAQACEESLRSMELLPKSQVRDWAVYQAYRIGVLTAAGAWGDAVAELARLQARWPDVRSTRTANLVMAAATRRGVPADVSDAARQCLAAAR
ncbi:helix-turn-helix domain-containing protein [Micromonospora chalcea]|uniref:helix-turn-helix domain-containing protein n=1 Tax=Micromonospora chalcea TaxID=1874 RepID=UPI003D718B0C